MPGPAVAAALDVVGDVSGAAPAGETPGRTKAVTVTALVAMLKDDRASRANEKGRRADRGLGVTTPPLGTRQTSLTKSASQPRPMLQATSTGRDQSHPVLPRGRK